MGTGLQRRPPAPTHHLAGVHPPATCTATPDETGAFSGSSCSYRYPAPIVQGCGEDMASRYLNAGWGGIHVHTCTWSACGTER